MKLEKTSFTPAYAITILILNDSTLTPDRIIVWSDGTHKSHGYDDLTRQVCSYGNSTSTRNNRSIYIHNGSSVVMSGRATLFDAGEITFSFDSFTSETIHVLAIED